MNRKIKRIRQILAAVVFFAAVAGLWSCEEYTYMPPAVDPNYPWSFASDIQPIFDANCISCHTATKAPDLREGKSYNALTKGAYITPPGETSELYTVMIGADHAARSSDADKLKVLYWIDQGAKNN
jgi:mono/diheme cytochrome c family protein